MARKKRETVPGWHPGDPKDENEFLKAWEEGKLKNHRKFSVQSAREIGITANETISALALTETGMCAEEIARRLNIQPRDVERVQILFHKALDLPVAEYAQKRSEVLSGIEILVIQAIMTELAFGSPTLGHLANTYKVINEARRLEEGKATSLSAIQTFSASKLSEMMDERGAAIDVTPSNDTPDK